MNTLIAQAIKKWWNSNPSTNGAAIAYYSIFSFAPLFIILVAVLGNFFGRQAVEGRLIGSAKELLGIDVSSFAQTLVAYTYEPFSGVVAALVSIVLIVFGALALFSQVSRALSDIWLDQSHAAEEHMLVSISFLKTKVTAIVMVLVLGLVLMASFVASKLIARFGLSLGYDINQFSSGLNLFNFILSLGFIILLFACMYKYIPRQSVSWKAALAGGLIGGILFIIGRYLLGLYIATQAISNAYGVAGAVMLIFIWFYYSAQILFFGAAWTYAVDQRRKMRQTS